MPILSAPLAAMAMATIIVSIQSIPNPNSTTSSEGIFVEGTSCLLIYDINPTFVFFKCKIHA
jgi:hypothetical protein